MLITSREAARRLARPSDPAATPLTREQSRRLLATGLAGPPVRSGRLLLYDEGAVWRLQRAPEVPITTLDEVSPLLVRLGPARPFELTGSFADRATVAGANWDVPLLARVAMRITGLDARPHPFVATVAHHVVLCADIVGWSHTRPPVLGHRPRTLPDALPREYGVDFLLAPPGDWAAPFVGARISIGSGRAWTVWGFAHHHPRHGAA